MDHKRLQEQYEEALFALLMEDVMKEEGERLNKENERLKQDANSVQARSLIYQISEEACCKNCDGTVINM